MKVIRFLKFYLQSAGAFWKHADNSVQYVAILSSNNKRMVREGQANYRKVVRRLAKKYSGAVVNQQQLELA